MLEKLPKEPIMAMGRAAAKPREDVVSVGCMPAPPLTLSSPARQAAFACGGCTCRDWCSSWRRGVCSEHHSLPGRENALGGKEPSWWQWDGRAWQAGRRAHTASRLPCVAPAAVTLPSPCVCPCHVFACVHAYVSPARLPACRSRWLCRASCVALSLARRVRPSVTSCWTVGQPSACRWVGDSVVWVSAQQGGRAGSTAQRSTAHHNPAP